MANTYHQIYLQLVFAVKYRNAMIDNEWKSKLCGVIGNLINESNCKTYIVNGVEDHIHCLIGLKPTIAVSDLMKNMKAKSSKFVNDNKLTKSRFEWQTGYGVFSYSQSQIDTLYKYIETQEDHHKKITFKDEYAKLLQEFNVQYEPEYLFEELI